MTVDAIVIRDPASGSTAAIAPQLGFNCFSFQAVVDERPVEVLWYDPQFREGTTRPSRSGIPILFPFAGRIRQARYKYQGRAYQLEAADGQGNAIHGFVYTRPWRVVQQSEASLTGEFQASVDDPSILGHWPSDFRIRATYEVRGSQLLATYDIGNPDSAALPWWFGTHPYFRLSLGGGQPADAIARFDVTQRWQLANLIPTGEVQDVADAGDFARGVRVEDRQFDDVFTGLRMPHGVWSGSVTDPTSGIATTIHFGDPFRDCVVFIPPHREAICLEPYTSAPNAFELIEQGIEPGLQELPPGASTSLKVEIAASRQNSQE
jgi:aldose 1-epimerase